MEAIQRRQTMDRITTPKLLAMVNKINKLTKSPRDQFTRRDGKLVHNVGNYQLDFAYGGVALHRVLCEKGSIKDVFSMGHATKREIFKAMLAFIEGYQTCLEDKERSV